MLLVVAMAILIALANLGVPGAAIFGVLAVLLGLFIIGVALGGEVMIGVLFLGVLTVSYCGIESIRPSPTAAVSAIITASVYCIFIQSKKRGIL